MSEFIIETEEFNIRKVMDSDYEAFGKIATAEYLFGRMYEIDPKLAKKVYWDTIVTADKDINYAVITKEFDSEMDFDTKEILDEAFKSFSGLDYYILMKEYGMFGEQIRNQEMCDFVVTSLFQKLLIEDKTIRSKADPVKTAYNKKNKSKKALASLNGKVNMSDLIGTIETYVEDKLKSYIK